MSGFFTQLSEKAKPRDKDDGVFNVHCSKKLKRILFNQSIYGVLILRY